MKKKLVVAIILLLCFVTALSFLSQDHVQEVKTEEIIQPKPQKTKGLSLYKGENDFFEAEFSVSKNSVNQLTLKQKHDVNGLPNSLTFTLSPAYDTNGNHKDFGTFSLHFEVFPKEFSFKFIDVNLLPSKERKLLLKITGEGQYQLFHLYAEE